MDVHIEEILSSIHTTSGNLTLADQRMKDLVRAVREATADEDRRERQARAERRIASSSREHLDED